MADLSASDETGDQKLQGGVYSDTGGHTSILEQCRFFIVVFRARDMYLYFVECGHRYQNILYVTCLVKGGSEEVKK